MTKSELIVKCKRLQSDAKIPSYTHEGDAGMDFCALEEITIAPGQIVKVKTGVAMEIPHGYVGLVWDKSGVSTKSGLKTLAGVVDSGYRGEVLIGMINLSDKPHTFHKGDKVAQMLIQKVERPNLKEALELSDTTRGEGGFGSTGKK